MGTKEYQGGKLGEEVVRGVDWLAEYLRDFVDRLAFIAGGLKAEEPTIRGAELALRDAERSAWEIIENLQQLPTQITG